MSRRSSRNAEDSAPLGWGPLRQYWRQIHRQEQQATAAQRARRKVLDQRRPRCRCPAYPWPHRPGGGLCRYPDPPQERWQPRPGGRPYGKRYAGLRRQIARANGLHPIRDRQVIEARMAEVLALAKQLKREHPRLRYRHVEITEDGVQGSWQAVGPLM